jgi:hypothetical protein
LGAGGHEREEWEGFFPDNVGVEYPAVGEAVPASACWVRLTMRSM